MSLILKKTSSYLPPKVVSNKYYEEYLETSDEWIRERTGIQERRFAEGEDTSSLALKAVEKLSLSEEDLQDIKGIFVATCTSDYSMPTIAAMIQKKIGAEESVFSMDFNVACSGFVSGVILLEKYLELGEKAILVGAEVLSKVLDKEDRSSVVLFGDGAAAALLEKKEGSLFYDIGTRGDIDKLKCRSINVKDEKCSLEMQGKDVFRFAVDILPKSIYRTLEKFDGKVEDIDHFVCHQANQRIIDHVRKKMKIDKDKLFMNLEKYGNTSAASIPIALDEMNKSGYLKPGQKVIVSGFGAGLSWATALIEIG